MRNNGREKKCSHEQGVLVFCPPKRIGEQVKLTITMHSFEFWPEGRAVELEIGTLHLMCVSLPGLEET